jgi:hypothetical protein
VPGRDGAVNQINRKSVQKEIAKGRGTTLRILFITTVGYGDITPVTDQARSFAMIEQFAGVFFMGVLIARLAGLYPPQKKRTVVQRIALHWVRVWQRYPRRYMMEYRASGIRLR